ncbi:MAG: hypothetical protein KF770_20825 [Anaerolineae bacterium]|nr:hypothetical protein [Anaerolineae bacterium]
MRLFLFTAMVIFLFGAAIIIVREIQTPVCESPVIAFVRSEERQPEVIVKNLIAELGGLPRTDLDIYEVRNSVTSAAAVYPVKDWSIELSRVARTPHLALFDDDPTYSQDLIIHVMFADGDTAVLHWSSWSYGIVACPVVISLGSGPPGELQVIHRP